MTHSRSSISPGAEPERDPAIVFGVLLRDALEDWPGRNQLMLALSKKRTVVLLERRRSGQIPRTRVERVQDHLYVARNAFVLRSSRLGHIWPVLAMIDATILHHEMKRAGIRNFVLWLTAVDPTLAFRVPDGALVYDCADPNFLPQEDSDFEQRERGLATRAKVTVSTAHSLLRKMKSYNDLSILLPNATSADFHPSAISNLPRPELLRSRTGPVVGYMGTVDWRFDPAMVSAAARALPDCTFAVVGRVNHDQEHSLRELREQPNVVISGQVDYDAGRAWVAAFDIGLIPFRINSINDAINPVKMYMYLMAGLPIVATDIEECRLNPFVITAASGDEFTAAIDKSLKELPARDREHRVDYALRNTWEARADEAVTLLRANGLLGVARSD